MKILIVDDHPLVRKGISSTLSFEEDVETILEAGNISAAMNFIERERPDLAIVDLYLGKEDGLEIIDNCKRQGLNTKILILTSSVRKDDFQRALSMGADGYILKEAFAEDIIYAIRVILRGRQFIDPEIMRYQAANTLDCKGINELTPREFDVLEELGKGLSNYEIARNLYISENTVKKHVSNILSKLELSHRTQAALFVKNSVNI